MFKVIVLDGERLDDLFISKIRHQVENFLDVVDNVWLKFSSDHIIEIFSHFSDFHRKRFEAKNLILDFERKVFTGIADWHIFDISEKVLDSDLLSFCPINR